MRNAGFPFIAIGLSTNRIFIFVGLVFAFVGLAILLRGGKR
jgi:hypothetical protein